MYLCSRCVKKGMCLVQGRCVASGSGRGPSGLDCFVVRKVEFVVS